MSESAEVDDAVRQVERLCEQRAWSELLTFRDRCRRAYEETGRQLWPAATLAEYRLALEAPGELAAAVLVEGTGHLGLGPLSEVAAQSHTWDELAPHVTPGPVAWLTAHERVVRGDDLRDAEVGPALEVPLALAEWEPEYLVPVYKPSEVESADPEVVTVVAQPVATGAIPADDPDTVGALRGLAERWVVESNAEVSASAVHGGVAEAIGALCADPVVWSAEVDATEALRRMAWAAAAGGAHGRRRGAAAGRFEALWATAAITGLLDDWPVPLDELGEAASELRWFVWQPDGPSLGWSLHLAVEDPAEGLAWAVSAVDRG